MAIDCIFTTYLTKRLGFSQHDSSHNGKGKSQPDDYKLMKGWYESLLKLCSKSDNMKGVIFHNECSQSFIDKYSNEYISFVKWEKQHRPSYNDERFWAFREFLTKRDDVQRAFSTDMFDVKFFRNPFEIMDKESKYHLYVGSEVGKKCGRKWVNKKMRWFKFPQISNDETVYNAGICGGVRKNLLKFYEVMISYFQKISTKHNANMAVYNQSLRDIKKRKWKIYTGFPLHNQFQSNKVPEGTYIKHK